MRRLWRMIGVGLCMVLPMLAMAQQAPVSCEDENRSLRYELNMTDMLLRTTRKQLADELRQTVTRAERAEQAQAKLMKDAKDAGKDPAKEPAKE
jgi:hypothetical protein